MVKSNQKQEENTSRQTNDIEFNFDAILADDEEVLRELLSDTLADMGIRITQAGDGEEALRWTAWLILISAVVGLVIYILYAFTPIGKMLVLLKI